MILAQWPSDGNIRLEVSCWYRNSNHGRENQNSVIVPSGAEFLIFPYKDRERERKKERECVETGKEKNGTN